MNQENFTRVICEMNGINPEFYPEKATLEGQKINEDFEETIEKHKMNLLPHQSQSLVFSIDNEKA